MSLNPKHPFNTLIALQNHPSWLLDKADNNTCFCLCTLASHEQEILTKVGNTSFSLIMIDETMNAEKIITAIRNQQGINQHIPAIVLTGNAENDHKKHLISLGFDDCLPKPLTNDSLEETIHFWQVHDEQSNYLRSLQTLLDNCNDNRKLAVMLYDKLFDSLPKQIDMIETALGNGDYRSAYDITHKLNGSVKTCFLKPIEEVSDSLEQTFNQNEQELIGQRFLMLKQSISDFLRNRERIFDYLKNEI